MKATSFWVVVLISTFSAGLLSVRAESVEDTWDLTHLYSSVEAFQKEKARLKAEIPQFKTYRGRLQNTDVLKQCLGKMNDFLKAYLRLRGYASMSADQDLGVQEAGARLQEVDLLGTEFDRAVSYIEPQLVAIRENVQELLRKEPNADFHFYLANVLRQAPHIRTEEGEDIIAGTGNILSSPYETYKAFTGAEIPWPSITLSDGTVIEKLTATNYTKYRAVHNRDDRKLVFDTHFGIWKKFEQTLGTMLKSAVDAHVFVQRARKHESTLQSALSENNVPEQVYRMLLNQTNKGLPTLHRYLKLRGRMLGVQDLHYYDLYPPIVNLDVKFPLEEGKEWVLGAVAPLGPEYVGVMEKALHSRWIDWYPRPGKKSGAYMSGRAYDVHPYMLMNYTNNYDSVSTLAHEGGHALHSWLANRAQPFATSRYPIFTAEIASTFNEALLLEYSLKQAKTEDERLFYLGNFLEQIRATFFRQAQFAEFELAIHQEVEKGEALTGEKLTEMYGALLKKYYGHDQGVLTIDDAYAVEWAIVPHFYYNFYVYQYATSIAAGSLFADEVLSGKPGAREKYLGLLKAGGSEYAYDLVKRAGVDLATPAPYQAMLSRMNRIMDEIEKILDGRK